MQINYISNDGCAVLAKLLIKESIVKTIASSIRKSWLLLLAEVRFHN